MGGERRAGFKCRQPAGGAARSPSGAGVDGAPSTRCAHGLGGDARAVEELRRAQATHWSSGPSRQRPRPRPQSPPPRRGRRPRRRRRRRCRRPSTLTASGHRRGRRRPPAAAGCPRTAAVGQPLPAAAAAEEEEASPVSRSRPGPAESLRSETATGTLARDTEPAPCTPQQRRQPAGRADGGASVVAERGNAMQSKRGEKGMDWSRGCDRSFRGYFRGFDGQD